MDSIASGAFKLLSQFSDVTSLLGSFSNADPVAGNRGKPWLFSENILVDIKGTSSIAVVVYDFGGWQMPPQLGTQRFRRLKVEFWVDPQRDGAGNIIVTSSATKLRGAAVFNAVHFRLQRTDPDTVLWGDMVTNACTLLQEPDFAQVPDGDSQGMGLLQGTAFYGVSFTGWTDATE